ncbi:MAG TPA: CAP domain-containing protein [Polyangiaceae bacterium]
MRGRVRGAALIGTLLALAVTAPGLGAEPIWSSWSASPLRLDEARLTPLERAALETCGPGETGLRVTALALLGRKLRGLPLPELDAVEATQRAAGEPHPWPRVWAASAHSLDRESTLQTLATWLASEPSTRTRRCGAAAGSSADGRSTLVVVAVDALADLQPLPTRARTGQWLSVDARLFHATGGRVVLMGPSGAARTLPSWFDGSSIHARFAAEGPGETMVQVVADLRDGPRPVLEAEVFTDVEPSSPGEERPAPGEDAAAGAPDADRLSAMITAARASAGLAPLARDTRLDAVAVAHAQQMAATHDLAHDAGDGGPVERLQVAGIPARDLGENVAHAGTIPLVHRALWSSPSHRANLLGRFTRMGVGVVRDGKGDAWAVEELVR